MRSGVRSSLSSRDFSENFLWKFFSIGNFYTCLTAWRITAAAQFAHCVDWMLASCILPLGLLWWWWWSEYFWAKLQSRVWCKCEQKKQTNDAFSTCWGITETVKTRILASGWSTCKSYNRSKIRVFSCFSPFLDFLCIFSSVAWPAVLIANLLVDPEI